MAPIVKENSRKNQSDQKLKRNNKASIKFINLDEDFISNGSQDSSDSPEIIEEDDKLNLNTESINKVAVVKRGRCQSKVNRMFDNMTAIETYLIDLTYSSNKLKDEELVFKLERHLNKFNNQLNLKPKVYKITDINPNLEDANDVSSIKVENKLVQGILPNVIDHLIELYFTTLHYSFPMIDKVDFAAYREAIPTYLIRAIACIAVKFSKHPQILAIDSNDIADRLFNVAKKESTSNYLTPTLPLVQALTLLGLHSMGSSSLGMTLTSQALKLALLLGSHDRNSEMAELKAIPNFDDPNSALDRTWIFVLESERILSLFHNRPLSYSALPLITDEADMEVFLPTTFQLFQFSKFTWRLTLFLTSITNYISKHQDDIIKRKLVLPTLQHVSKIVDYIPQLAASQKAEVMKHMLFFFRSTLTHMVSGLYLIYYIPQLLHYSSKHITEPIYISKQIYSNSIPHAEKIFDIFVNQLAKHRSRLVAQPPTRFYELFLTALFYKLVAVSGSKIVDGGSKERRVVSEIGLKEQLDAQIKFTKVVKVFQTIAQNWQFGHHCYTVLASKLP